MGNKSLSFRRGTVLLILGVAFALRVWGLDFGLPYEFHPDERQYINKAISWYTTGQLEPGVVNPPLFVYVLIAAYAPWLGLSPSESSTAWITTTYTFARLWSAAFGLLTVALAYPLGMRLYSRTVGLLASLVLAGLFLPARESHFAVNDTAAAFFAFLAIYFSLNLSRQRWSAYLIAGIAVGLAAATKLTAGAVVIAMLTAHGLVITTEPLRQRWLTGSSGRNLWAGLAAAVLTWLVINLQILWQLPHAVNSISKHLQFGSEGYKGLQMAPVAGWVYYLYVLGWGIGWLLLAAALTGLAWVLASKYRPGYVLAIFPVALFLYMGAQKILFARFLLPAVPPLVLLATLALVVWSARWTFFQRHRGWVWPAAVGLLLIQPLANLLWFNHLLTLPDTRQLATTWLLATYPADTVLVKESYSVLPSPFLFDKAWPFKTIQINERGPSRNDPDYYLAHKTNLIAVSNFTYSRVRQDPSEEQARQVQLANLAQQAELVKTFDPYRRQPNWFYLDELYGPAGEVLQRVAPGPLIKIYQLPYENQPYSTAIPTISVPVDANFDNKMVLLGYDLPTRRAEPGGSIPVTLYWQSPARITETLVIFDRLLDANQQPWGGYDRWPQETANTNLWHPGEVVVDTFNLSVSPAAPAGIYTIDIGLYNQTDPAGTPLSLVRDGQPIEQTSVRLGPLKIGAAPPGITATEIEPQHKIKAEFGQPPAIALRGFDLTQADNELQLTLYWQSLTQTTSNLSIFAHLRNTAGETVAQKDGPAGSGSYPTSLWDTGEIVADSLSIPLPPDLPAGNYSLVIGLYNLADGTRLALSDTVNNELDLLTLEYTP